VSEGITTWRKEIADVAKGDELIACTLSDEELDMEFDAGYGVSEGRPFTAWSSEWVYLPAVYDGAEWVERVPRNPAMDKTTSHIGGQ